MNSLVSCKCENYRRRRGGGGRLNLTYGNEFHDGVDLEILELCDEREFTRDLGKVYLLGKTQTVDTNH